MARLNTTRKNKNVLRGGPHVDKVEKRLVPMESLVRCITLKPPLVRCDPSFFIISGLAAGVIRARRTDEATQFYRASGANAIRLLCCWGARSDLLKVIFQLYWDPGKGEGL